MTTVTLRDEAYTRIRAWIESGELAKGAVTSEAKLCARLDMSRTPIRAALQRLELEGYVRIVPKHGVLVLDASAERVGDALDLAAALLLVAAGKAERMNRTALLAEAAAAGRTALAELSAPFGSATADKLADAERTALTAVVGTVLSAELTALFAAQLARLDAGSGDGPPRWRPPFRQRTEEGLRALLHALERGGSDAGRLTLEYFHDRRKFRG